MLYPSMQGNVPATLKYENDFTFGVWVTHTFPYGSANLMMCEAWECFKVDVSGISV